MVLKKKFRMTTRDFSAARRPLRQATTDLFSIKVFSGSGTESKYAVVVSTKVALTATIRNRFRRRVGELLRTGRFSIGKGFHVVVIVRRPLPLGVKVLHQELATALEKSGILSQ